jgi:hypothetical protein
MRASMYGQEFVSSLSHCYFPNRCHSAIDPRVHCWNADKNCPEDRGLDSAPHPDPDCFGNSGAEPGHQPAGFDDQERAGSRQQDCPGRGVSSLLFYHLPDWGRNRVPPGLRPEHERHQKRRLFASGPTSETRNLKSPESRVTPNPFAIAQWAPRAKYLFSGGRDTRFPRKARLEVGRLRTHGRS